MSAKKILSASNDDFQATTECLLTGPTLASILKMLRCHFEKQPAMTISIDSDDAWVDAVTFYKSTRFDVTKRLRVQLNGQPALDTGGVRTQLYSAVFEQFAQNRHVKLFGRPECHLRPLCTSEARLCGLFKVLGSMVAHSIAQAGVGFPYLSPACYWYIADGEQRSLQYLSTADVSCQVAAVVSKVSIHT